MLEKLEDGKKDEAIKALRRGVIFSKGSTEDSS
jgi:hypothetical protein